MTPRPAADVERGNVIPIRPTGQAAVETKERRSRRSFGKVRGLPSGRFQASYVHDGTRHLAPITFDTKGDAGAWLDMRHAEILEHRWKPAQPADPTKIGFKEYGQTWIETRDLSPRTRAEYRRMFNDPRLAFFHPLTLDAITPAMIKAWWNEQDASHPTARRRAYELLRAILMTASRPDEDTDAEPLLTRNPARLTTKTLNRRPVGAPARAKESKPATLEQLNTIAEAMPERYRAMVLLAAWCAPRFGELTELRRKDLHIGTDTEGRPVGLLDISRAVVWPEPGRPVVKEPKSRAGIRVVDVPPHILPYLQKHLDTWAAPGPEGLLFPAVQSGGHMQHGVVYKAFGRARRAAGRPDLRWHDLRHTGATWLAQAGATVGELMVTLGHSTIKAALIYQHQAEGRGPELARRMSDRIEGK